MSTATDEVETTPKPIAPSGARQRLQEVAGAMDEFFQSDDWKTADSPTRQKHLERITGVFDEEYSMAAPDLNPDEADQLFNSGVSFLKGRLAESGDAPLLDVFPSEDALKAADALRQTRNDANAPEPNPEDYGDYGLKVIRLEKSSAQERYPKERLDFIKKTGLRPEHVDRLMDDREALERLKDNAVVMKTTGDVAVPPQKAMDEAEWNSAVDATNATPAKKAKAKAHRLKVRDQLAGKIEFSLAAVDPEWGKWSTSMAGEMKDASVGEKVERFIKWRKASGAKMSAIDRAVDQNAASFVKQFFGLIGGITNIGMMKEAAATAGEIEQANAQIRSVMGGAGATGFAVDLFGGLAPTIAFSPLARLAATNLGALRLMGVTAAAQGYGGKYADASAAYSEQGLSDQDAHMKAQLPALVSALTTYALARMMPRGVESIGQINSAKNAAKTAYRKWGGELLADVGDEALEEALQAVSDEITAKFTYDPSKDMKTAVSNVVYSGLMGGIGGGVVGAVSRYANKVKPILETAEQMRAAGYPMAAAETEKTAEIAATEQYWQDVAKAQKRAAEHTQANEGPLTERAAYGRTGDVYDAFGNVQRKAGGFLGLPDAGNPEGTPKAQPSAEQWKSAWAAQREIYTDADGRKRARNTVVAPKVSEYQPGDRVVGFVDGKSGVVTGTHRDGVTVTFDDGSKSSFNNMGGIVPEDALRAHVKDAAVDANYKPEPAKESEPKNEKAQSVPSVQKADEPVRLPQKEVVPAAPSPEPVTPAAASHSQTAREWESANKRKLPQNRAPIPESLNLPVGTVVRAKSYGENEGEIVITGPLRVNANGTIEYPADFTGSGRMASVEANEITEIKPAAAKPVEYVAKVAVKDAAGTVRTGQIHALIEGADEAGSVSGYVTNTGRFVTREEADTLPRKALPMTDRGDVTAEEIQDPFRRLTLLEKEMASAKTSDEKQLIQRQMESTKDEISSMGYVKRGDLWHPPGVKPTPQAPAPGVKGATSSQRTSAPSSERAPEQKPAKQGAPAKVSTVPSQKPEAVSGGDTKVSSSVESGIAAESAQPQKGDTATVALGGREYPNTTILRVIQTPEGTKYQVDVFGDKFVTADQILAFKTPEKKAATTYPATPQLIRQIGDIAVQNKQPVDQAYIDAIGGRVPDGYVKRGNRWEYTLAPSPAPAAPVPLLPKPVIQALLRSGHEIVPSGPQQAGFRSLVMEKIGKPVPKSKAGVTAVTKALAEYLGVDMNDTVAGVKSKMRAKLNDMLAAHESPAVAPAPTGAKTRLDLMLDGVERTGKELTIEVTDANRDNLTKIIETAEKRGLRASTDGRFVLIRPAEPQAKEPWQMTKAEAAEDIRKTHQAAMVKAQQTGEPWDRSWRGQGGRAWGWLTEPHEQAIRIALREGKPVPAEVLADYPDLAKQSPAPAVPQAEGGIFGYSWADIRSKQQGGTLAALIRGNAPKATESDFAVLEKHGMDWLYDNEKVGIIDRLGLPADRPSKKAVEVKPVEQATPAPKDTTERIQEAAYRDASGKIYNTGAFHDSSKLPKKFQADNENARGVEPGWLTSSGRFVGREEGFAIAAASKQVKDSYKAEWPNVLGHFNVKPETLGKQSTPAPTPAPVTEAAALRAKIVKGATVEVSLVRGSKLTHRAKVQDVDTQNGVVTVTFKKGKKFNGGETQTVRLDQVAPLKSVQTRMLNEVQFEGMTEDQKRQTKADAKEFDRLVRDHPEMGWYEWRVDDLAGTKSGDMDIEAERKRASMEAMEALGGDPTWNPKGNSVIKAELLPKLKAAIEEKARELAREEPDSAFSDDTDLLPQGEAPATPKLRPSDGKGTGELLQGDAAPFNLVAETAADIAKREAREAAEQVAKEAKDAAEAKAKQDKEQGNLFDEDPFAIADSAPTTSLPVASVQRAVRVVAERLAGAMPHEVIADGSAFPDRMKEVFLERYGASGDLNRIRGAVVNGKIWINAAAIENPRQAIETFMHEAAGHGGTDMLLKAFGEKATAQLDAMLKRLFPDEHAAVKRSYPSREQVSETLAKIMEGVGPEMSAQHRTRWQRVVDWLRNALNKLGVKQWSTNDVMALLRRGVDAVRKQRAVTPDAGAVRMSANNEQSKPFYSALTKTVQGLPQETMTVQQAAGMLGEYQVHKTTVLPDGKKKVEVLGKFNPLDKAKATALATQKGGEVKWASQKGVKEDEVNMAGILTDPLSPLSGKQPGDKVTKAELTGYALERQATVQDVVLGQPNVEDEARRDAILERYKDLTDAIVANRTRREEGEITLEESRENARVLTSERSALDDEINAINKRREDTHFSQYQLPGADEGSYREMFVTWPNRAQQNVKDWTASRVTTKDYGPMIQGGGRAVWEIRNKDGEYIGSLPQADYVSGDEAIAALASKGNLSLSESRKNWNDGHPQYSDIANPIVRIRRNIRTDSTGRKTYFIEEMQGPGKGEQEKMPPELRKRIYEIGMKRALRDAVDEGADAIAWTTGEQQAERYSLEKEVEGIEWEKDAAGEWSVDVDTKQDGLINAAVSPDGVIVSSDESRLNGKPLEDFVGKEIAEKIMASKKGKLSGEGLKVGGKGLKRVYDQMLPAIANDLAKKFGVKAGTARFGESGNTDGFTAKLEQQRAEPFLNIPPRNLWRIENADGKLIRFVAEHEAKTEAEAIARSAKFSDANSHSAHSLPIPEALKTQQRGGNVLFSLKGENPEATSTTKKAVMDKEREVAMLQGSADKLLQDIRKSGRPPTVEEMQQIAAIDSLIAKRQAEIQAEASNVAQGATPPEINIADMNAEPPDREETGESGPRTYGGKFDSMDAQRAERGLPPLARRFRKANRVLWDAAVKRFETEPKWADRLVDEISSGEKTVLTDEEFAGVFAQQIDLHNKRQEAADRARDPNLSEEEQRDALDQFQYYEKKLQASEILKGMAGSEAGAALQSLKLMANEDFSLAAMEARERKAKQSGLTPEEVDRIRDEATRIAKAQADLDARKAATEAAERIANAEAKIAEWSKIPSRVLEYAKQKLSELVSAGNAAGERLRARAGQVNVGVDPTILGDIFLFARGKIAQGIESFGNFAASTASEFGEWVSPYLKPAWDKAMKYFNANQPERKVSSKRKARQQAATEAAASIEDGIRAMAEEGLPDDMGRYVKQLANEYVKSGATTVKGVMARLHAFLDPVMGNPTDDVLLDLWTDYGKGKAATQDALKRLQSQIRQEALIVRQIIDAEAALVRSQAGEDVGDYLKLTGQQRVPVRDQARALAQQLNELKKKIPPPQGTAESRRQSALDALEKRTRNRIKDLRFEIAKGERTIKNRGVTPTSPNLEALRAELATVKAEHLAVFGRREATPEQKLKSAIKSAERAEQKALAELEAAKRGVFTRPVQKGAETRNEVLVIRARADAARAETQALKELANPPLSDAQKRLDAALVARERWEQMLAGEQQPTSRQPQESLTQLEEDARMEIAAMRELAAQIRRDAKPATDPDDAKVRALEAAAAEYERRVNESDFTAKSKTTTADSARVAQARALRDAALAAYNAAKNAAGVTEQTKLANRKAAMLRQIADLTDRLAKSDFEKRPPRPPVDLSKDSEAVRIASDLQEIKSNYAKRLLHYIKERRGGYEKFTDALWTAFTAERSLMGSGDLSAPRQAVRMVKAHPIMAAKAMWRSIRTIFSQKQAVSYEAERKLRPNYALYKPMKIQMPSVEAEAHDRMAEEGVRSNIEDWADIKLSGNPLLVLPKLVPKLLGHYVRASSRTFTTFLNELAADVADYRINELRDKPMSKIEKEALGDMINSARGRGLKAGAGKLAQFVFYSANFLAARAKNLSGYHIWRRNSSMRIRKIALKEQFRAIAGWMVVSAISRYFYGDTGDDEDMFDKAKRLFKMKVTDSDARMEYDYTGGEVKLARIGAALIEGISTTIQAMRSGQEEADKQRAFKSYATIGREIRSISAPWVGVATDLFTGSNYDGKVPTVTSIARDLTVPLAWRSADEFFERAGFAKTVGAKLQEAIGVGVSVTRDKTAPKERRYSR